jgi:hypothetical protein
VCGVPTAAADFNFVENVLDVSSGSRRGPEETSSTFSTKLKSADADGTHTKKMAPMPGPYWTLKDRLAPIPDLKRTFTRQSC